MRRDYVASARAAAERFIKEVDALEEAQLAAEEAVVGTDWWIASPYAGSAQSGTVRRASMDLTRALAKMRKP